jgi:Zn-dependent protease
MVPNFRAPSTSAISAFGIWAYSSVFGFQFAVGFVLLLLIHEWGHLLAARMKGIRTSKPVFIPFVGALIALKDLPKNADQDAFIAFGGPIAGSIGAFMCLIVFALDANPFWLALAYTGFFLNLLNLVPVYPLDGGRITSAISTKLWILGIGVLAVLDVHWMNPVLFVILIFGILQAYKAYRHRDQDVYYAISPRKKCGMVLRICSWSEC